MPKHKYSYGEELREHSERIARHYGFAENGVFRTTVSKAEWNDKTRRWRVDMEQNRGAGQEPLKMTAFSQFFCLCVGVLNHPKAPKIPGLENFHGDVIHTARWNYDVSGGSPATPELSKLKGKRVGVIGTGATAVQSVPKLAEVASDLYVFQRTPSSVGTRGQQVMSQEEWQTKIATGPGWQTMRRRNFELLTQGEAADDDEHLTDGWTKLATCAVNIGNSAAPAMEKKDLPDHIDRFVAADVPFQEKIRQRVDDIVRDRKKAEMLKPWYSTWCKRPCFHDDYLETFNKSNVHLVDTSENKGALKASSTGLAVGDEGTEISLDVLILATGFRAPANFNDPGFRADMTIIGHGGVTMAEKWATKGAGSLHGVASASFPNFFMSNYTHVSVSPNFTSGLGMHLLKELQLLMETFADDPNRHPSSARGVHCQRSTQTHQGS
jgi:cation diffusion facilitator CzcD-associated flavoprotein CzcO